MYRQTNNVRPTSATCPKCGSTRIRFTYKDLFCTNCGELVAKLKSSNKYGAKRTEFKGKKYDSKFEATIAEQIDARKLAGEIKDYDTQYKVEMWAYREDGEPAFKVSHKVDFRIHHKDGSFELVEAKGVETADYKMRRKFLENIWLPMHKDHIYTVVKQNSYGNWRKNR